MNYIFIILFLRFFFNETATTEIYTLSLHDALPICLNEKVLNSTPNEPTCVNLPFLRCFSVCLKWRRTSTQSRDRKSTRLNSSHVEISYAVLCLKKKNKYSVPNHLHKYYFYLTYYLL